MKYFVAALAFAIGCFAAAAMGAEPILLDFSASWCKPCQSMRLIINKLAAEGVDVRIVDCSNGVPASLAGWKVDAFPTFIVIRDKREVTRHKGACSEQNLRKMLAAQAVTVNYQAINSETIYRLPGEPPADFIAGMYDFHGVWDSPPDLSPTHTDILRHLRPEKSVRAKYASNGPVTQAHEDVHVINSELSREIGPGVWSFFMPGNKAFALREPKISKTLVESKVPDSLRKGPNWQLYMTGMNPDHAFVILDEWIAYIASAQVANELYGTAEHRIRNSVTNGTTTEVTREIIIDRAAAIEFAGYATVLLQCIERFEPDYPDLEQLRQFVSMNIDRTMGVQHRPVTVAYQQYFNRFRCDSPPQQQWQPSPQVRPAQPIARPQQPLPPVPAKPCNCEARIAKLEAEIVRLQGMAAPGQPGATGAKGDKGEPGAPGKDATVNIAAIVAEVAKQTKPCECKSADDPATRPGQPALQFDIRPRVRK